MTEFEIKVIQLLEQIRDRLPPIISTPPDPSTLFDEIERTTHGRFTVTDLFLRAEQRAEEGDTRLQSAIQSACGSKALRLGKLFAKYEGTRIIRVGQCSDGILWKLK